MRHACFTLVKNEADRVVIRDEGPWEQYPTVTNDAEHVVELLVRNGVLTEGKRLFYYDSEGELDELRVRDGKFAGFGPGK